jgi:hypothetical protein
MNLLVLLNSFLGVDFYDNDFEKLLFKFIITFICILIVVRGLYYPNAKKKEYAFSYMMLGIVIFFISFTLKKFELGTGMALGLFAIFGIIRYRTDTMPVKEMTYLFIVIGISVMNALANKKVSYTEVLFTNVIIVSVSFALEKIWFKNVVIENGKPVKQELKQALIYNELDLLKPDKKEELMADLKMKTGLEISRIKIDLINYNDNTAQLIVYYPNEQIISD